MSQETVFPLNHNDENNQHVHEIHHIELVNSITM